MNILKSIKNKGFQNICMRMLGKIRVMKNRILYRLGFLNWGKSIDEKSTGNERKISQILTKYDTDKVRGNKKIGHSYGEAYDEVFSWFKNPHNILEVGAQKGGSLLAWKEYFPGANVYGLDIVDVRTYKSDAVNFILTDVKDYKTDLKFDIIIDDGSHFYDDVIFVVNNFLENLNSGGVLVIEDVQHPEEWVYNIKKVLPKGYTLSTKDMRHINGYTDDFLIIIRKI
jgi:SAM-dependent methyltransferase